ncbi:MAG: Uncharacterized protein G01um10143_249 [Parcubacteria group bacterium Gr01-1014_3]|nr:MAG: Uncharacterized protein G01um10143_249 [Parcubacteria group bacterium Gr01-1014_3]
MIRWLVYISIVILTFGTRKLLGHITPGFDEYESFFLYLSDLVLLLLVFGNFKFLILNFKSIFKFSNISIAGFLVIAFISVFSAFSAPLALYSFARLLLVILAAVSTAILIQKEFLKTEWIFGGIAIAAVIQSVIALGQFIFQKSLGLIWLGEPVVGPTIGGASKIVVEGFRILRAYGTFPHPNILAAFLLLGLISLCYFWLKRPIVAGKDGILSDLKFGLPIFAVSLGLVMAFSRAAWLVGGFILAVFLLKAIFSRENFRQGIRLAIFLVAISILLIFSFGQYIFPRAAVSVSEPSVTQRISYNQLAFELIKSRPLGVGVGNQVLYAVKNEVYQRFGMNEVWQWQPIHNIYLLIASEVGVLGLLAILIFLGRLLIFNFKFSIFKKAPMTNDQLLITTTMLSALLLLGLFDHFLWTLQPGRIMLWLVIALVLANKKPGRLTG